jgi:toxin ParE1/3/4
LRRKIHTSALAESDLIGIWAYSFQQWDEAQADKYLDELDRGIALLADNSALGSKRDHVREGYRVLFINRHAIYYTVTTSTIRIIRVLHEQMDPDKHL